MVNHNDDYYGDYEEWYDETREDAKKIITDLFEQYPGDVFYGRQLQVMLEGDFFHWITAKALKELLQEGKISGQKIPLIGNVSVGFYWHNKNRYWRRKVEHKRKIIAKFSRVEFTAALGIHAETMFDAALAKQGFIPTSEKVREYKGKAWTETGHDLDRVYGRDGIVYGCEIKNTLPYIPKEELQVKLNMCKTLEIIPLFIMRMAPKTYNWEIIKAGGFSLIFKYQLYPFGFTDLVREVRNELRLSVDCPKAIEIGTIERLKKFHDKMFSM